MTYRVLIACEHLQRLLDRYAGLFAKHDIEIEVPEIKQQLREGDLLQIIERFDGVVAGDDEFTARVLEAGKKLKVIAKWGIGVDGIDLGAAERLGIQVFNTPGVFSDEVADVAIAYVVLLARQLHQINRSVRSGGWPKIQGTSLRDKTLGIIGAGNNGRAIARRATVMGMRVLAYDPIPVPDDVASDVGLTEVPLQDLLVESDFVLLCCSLTRENRHMLGSEQFSLMKAGAYIINVSRGPLIDESALVEALHQGKLAGAALDVFEDEPLRPDSPLRQYDSCIFGCHNCSNTLEAVLRVNELTIQNLFKGLGVNLEPQLASGATSHL